MCYLIKLSPPKMSLVASRGVVASMIIIKTFFMKNDERHCCCLSFVCSAKRNNNCNILRENISDLMCW